ncbi:tyrosine-type recombinase/integrase [Plantactinospora sp. CA-290183]|uniref:tyrosine-type recombinase/integrase n=1 Tax=Plantactinospora sp. CA-290183 TaxID=3240006 RepID=UPI003D939452
MKGSVFKRCPCGVTGGGGKRPPACKKKHGTWSYVVDLDPGPDGSRRQEKRGGYRDKDEAEDALAAVLKGLADGTYAHDERKTVGAFLDEWLADKVANGLRLTTARSYRQHIGDYLKPELGKLRLRDLRPGHITAMLRKARKTTSSATVQRIRATLRSALSSAVRQQLVAFNAAKDLDVPAAPRTKVRPWEPAELGKFLDHAITDLRFGALYELVAATGLRRGEAAALRWEDVDLAGGVLVVRQQLVGVALPEDAMPPCPYCPAKHKGLMFGPVKTSSGEDRRVELDATTVGVLLAAQLAQKAEQDDWGDAYVDHGLVFAREDGNPLALDAVTKRFKALCQSAGVRPVRLHDLRHGAASLRMAAGVDISVISKVLGHSSISITNDTYGHLLAGVGKDAAERASKLVPRNQRDQSVTSTAKTAAPDDSETAVKQVEHSAPPGTRTPNPRIKSPRGAPTLPDSTLSQAPSGGNHPSAAGSRRVRAGPRPASHGIQDNR